MMFDNTPIRPRSRWEAAKDHLPVVLLVFAAVGVAAGIHLAATAVVVVAAGHLVVAGMLLALRVLRSRRSGESLR